MAPDSPELDDSEKKTSVLRQYLRDLFGQYVERRAAPPANSPESIRQILAKHRPDVIQTSVEMAAAHDLPIEASFEHRHEIKGDDPANSKAPDKPAVKSTSKPKKPKPKATPKQRAEARRVAQKFVEPVMATEMVKITTASAPVKPRKVNQTASQQMIKRSFWLALGVGLVFGIVYVAR